MLGTQPYRRHSASIFIPLFTVTVLPQPPSSCHLLFPSSLLHYRPINWRMLESTGVFLRSDLCAAVRSREQRAAACWSSADLRARQERRGCRVVRLVYSLVTIADNIHKHHSVYIPEDAPRTQPQMYTTTCGGESCLCTSVTLRMICLLGSALLIRVTPALTEPSQHQAGGWTAVWAQQRHRVMFSQCMIVVVHAKSL